MPVTDDEVAALRAHLQGNQALQQELYERVTPAYSTLVAAAFLEAVNRRFGGRDSAAEVMEYVADVRARSPKLGQQIDPSAAERLIRRVLTDVDVSDIGSHVKGQIYIIFLVALVSDAEYDEDQLDAFLTVARKAADDALEH